MSKLLIILKVLGFVLAALVMCWFAVIFLTALAYEWAGDMKDKFGKVSS